MEGEILHDQSMLTGESIPIEAVARLANLSKALVRRGVALARP
jgi:cation transport ATPase